MAGQEVTLPRLLDQGVDLRVFGARHVVLP
jgi:hypothetical protein